MELTIADLKPFLPGLEEALDDESVSEVMVNEPGTAFVERAGRMTALDAPALTAEAVARAAIQIARPLGEDPATDPIIDARLADGSRVAVCSPPAAPTTAITIRRFGGWAFTIAELTATGSLPAPVVEAAAAVLRGERNVLISGGTGSGKTTLLNALVSLLPAGGRVISIEDTLELQLRRTNGLRFEARGLAGRDVTIRDLVRHALRHRPDHIVVGEVRGAEAADLLQALNTGHGGSLTTVHANNAEAALSRLATCAMQASGELPWAVVCRGVVDGIEAVIHQTRTPEGVRRVDQMVRVRDYDAAENRWVVEPVWPAPAATAGRNGQRAGGEAAGPVGIETETRPAPQTVTNATNGGARMSERDKSGAQERAPVRVATREQFDEAVAELFRTGQPIEAPSLEMLDAWDVDLEDEAGGIEGL